MNGFLEKSTDNNLIKNKNKEVGESFKWLDRQGNYHVPSNMETRHLFFTLKMVWNHYMPEEAKIHPFQEYEFPKFYTEEYMKTAVIVLSKELFKRNNIKDFFYDDIEKMINYLSRHQLEDKNNKL